MKGSSPDLRQDEDVLDTWFSSWLWPISVYDGINRPEGNPDLDYYYPTDDLVTAPEILFFWVARMIIAGYEYQGKKPFGNVYLTGIVRDKLGRKMSKSLGNSPDPIELMERYGADGVRVGMLFSSPAGNDLLFDEKLCEQGRNFSNKIWNALRLVRGWEVREAEASDSNKVAVRWFESALNQEIAEVEDLFAKYRISDALMAIYKLIWDDFCSWYLEIVKPEYGSPIDAWTYQKTIDIFGRLMQVLHPFMPFITEEVWHLLQARPEKGCIMVSSWPVAGAVDDEMIQGANLTRQVVNNLRNIRQSNNISPKTPLHLYLRARDLNIYYPFADIIRKLGNIESVDVIGEKLAGTTSFLVGTDEWYVPLEEGLDPEKEKELIRKELEYFRGFLASVNKKLENERFVQNAPADVVENERRKQTDAIRKIQTLEEKLAHFDGMGRE
jgi:valyl-tRNA synthetase